MPEAGNLEYWQQIKDLLVEIAALTCEVDTIFCHCGQQDCPFRKTTYNPISHSATPSPSTSPVLQHQPTHLKPNVSYGGFESMIQSTDVEYDNKATVEVENKKEPLIKRDKKRMPVRRAAVRRKKNTNLVPSRFGSTKNFRDRSQTFPALRRNTIAM